MQLKKVKIKFCPKCGEEDVLFFVGGGAGLYECKKCKFRSSIFPEKEVEISKKTDKKIQKEVLKNENKM
jgi:Zn ribbon nucleic-acid-binding protein